MFDELSSRFEDAVKGLRGEAKINENNINDALIQVKKALLERNFSHYSLFRSYYFRNHLQNQPISTIY